MRIGKLILLIIICIPVAARTEFVFKKDGSIIKGIIQNDEAKVILLKDEAGLMHRIDRRNIMRIIYTNLYMGKVFIRLTDGSVKEGYRVDENQDTYTFREKLYEPKEFTIPREKVLFLARTNPNELSGKAATDSADLKWVAPFLPPDEYNVYLKSPDKDYRVAEKTKNTSITVKNLKSNTLYRLKVTALDNMGTESLPSNEIELLTKNIRPETPGSVSVTKILSPDGKSASADISWDACADPDGKVTGYNIYKESGGAYKKIGSASTTKYTAVGLDPNETHYFMIRSVDDKGDESGDSRKINTGKFGFTISAKAAYIFPMGDLKELADWGYGGLIALGYRGMPVHWLMFSLESGYFTFTSANDQVDSLFMVPITAKAGIRLPLFSFFSAVPVVGLGYSYSKIAYKSRDSYIAGKIYSMEDTGFDPIAVGGLTLHADIAKSVIINVGLEYTTIFEKDGRMNYFTAFAGAEILF
ncbi:MAG: fibronectin type III domain-containing protein [Spirochaetota bacterium]